MAIPAMSSPLRQAWLQEQIVEAEMPATPCPSVKAWSLARILSPAETQSPAVAQPLRRDSIASSHIATQRHPTVREESETSRGENILQEPVSGHDPVSRGSHKLMAHHPSSPEPPLSLSHQSPPKSPAQAGTEVDGTRSSQRRRTSTHNNAQLHQCVSESSTKRMRKRKRNADTGHIHDDQWKVKQVVAKRNKAKREQTANIEWLVDWDGTNPRTGKTWPMSWEKDEDVSEDLKVAYEGMTRHGTSKSNTSRSVDAEDTSSCEIDAAKSPSPRSKLRATIGASKQTSKTSSTSNKQEPPVSTKRSSSTALPSTTSRSSKVAPNAEHLTAVISSVSSEGNRQTERQQEDEKQAAQGLDKVGDNRSLKPDLEFDPSTGAYGTDGLYIVRRVVGVKKVRGQIVRCRVEWEGNDPGTGRPWALTWEPIRSVPAVAIAAWRAVR